MPDISLIAPLCNLFNITSDELLGIDIAQRQKHIQNICSEAAKYSDRGYNEKARKILEDGLAKYPDNIDIIYDLMYLSFWEFNSNGDSKYVNDAIKWGEKILRQSTADHQRHGAIQILCYSYKSVGRIDEAIKMAKSMPILCESQESLLAGIYSGSMEYKAKQIEANCLLQQLSNSLFYLQVNLDSGELAYTDEEFSILRDKRIALLHLFFENGDLGFYHTQLCDTHSEQALYYAKKGDDDKTISHLQSAVEHAIKFITSFNEMCTSLVFRGMDSGSWSSGVTENDAGRVLRKMEYDAFNGIREKEDFIKIKQELSKYSGEWSV